jgi:hypothetical protein
MYGSLMAFFQGPPPMPHRGECSFRGGPIVRALKDAGDLAMRKVPAAILVLAATVVVGVALAAPPKATYGERLELGLLGAVLGFALGTIVLAIWTLTPWGRNRHWRLKIDAIGKEDEPESHSWLTIQSEHWHVVRNVECAVTTPDGVTHTAGAEPTWLDRDMNLAPGHSVHRIYPSSFGVEPPVLPGKYKVKWTTEGPKGPRTLRRGSWKVI